MVWPALTFMVTDGLVLGLVIMMVILMMQQRTEEVLDEQCDEDRLCNCQREF